MNKSLEQQLQEAEEQIASVRLQLKERDTVEEVKPVFPKKGHWLNSTGRAFSERAYGAGTREFGNSFYTKEEAEKESLRRQAVVRVRESINLANKGLNGFRYENFVITYAPKGLILDVINVEHTKTEANAWEMLRSRDIGAFLLSSPKFVEDYKLMKGID